MRPTEATLGEYRNPETKGSKRLPPWALRAIGVVATLALGAGGGYKISNWVNSPQEAIATTSDKGTPSPTANQETTTTTIPENTPTPENINSGFFVVTEVTNQGRTEEVKGPISEEAFNSAVTISDPKNIDEKTALELFNNMLKMATDFHSYQNKRDDICLPETERKDTCSQVPDERAFMELSKSLFSEQPMINGEQDLTAITLYNEFADGVVNSVMANKVQDYDVCANKPSDDYEEICANVEETRNLITLLQDENSFAQVMPEGLMPDLSRDPATRVKIECGTLEIFKVGENTTTKKDLGSPVIMRIIPVKFVDINTGEERWGAQIAGWLDETNRPVRFDATSILGLV